MPGIELVFFEWALLAISGVAYAVLMALALLSRRGGYTRVVLAAACASTIVSAILGANGPYGFVGAWVELTAAGGWLIFILHVTGKKIAPDRRLFLLLCVCGLLIGGLIFGFPVSFSSSATNSQQFLVGIASRLALSVFGVLLIENIYRNTAEQFRWHINLLCIGLGVFLCYDLVLYADALLFRRISRLLWDGRWIALTTASPLIAAAVARNPNWDIDIHVSRKVVFHTATLIGSGIFLIALAVTGEVFREVNPSWGGLAEITLIVAGATAIAVLLTSGFARSRLQRALVDNFFSHRYDYRREWLRSIERLSSDPDLSSVQSRVINAVAEIADSPAGVLWVRDLEGSAFLWAGSWNCPPVAASEPADSAFVEQFRGASWIIELQIASELPGWLDEIANAWLAVPLAHRDELLGFVVLTKPRAPLKLDREIFDLLRIVGRQAATHIAEQRFAQALADTHELHTYGKRFAFAVHDMKNVSGQLEMLLRNAELHKDDPQFQEDVLVTIKSAADRMNRLLDRLSSQRAGAKDGHIAPSDVVRDEVIALQRVHGGVIGVDDAAEAAAVVMDPGALRSVIRHLCENAIEASPGYVRLRLTHDALRLKIEVIDKGPGMTPEFVRDQLFQPFGSTKCKGLGIGAYQARELVRAAGGDLVVSSQLGNGTIMSILLPCVVTAKKENLIANVNLTEPIDEQAETSHS